MVDKKSLVICIAAYEYGGQGTVVENECDFFRDVFDTTLVASTIAREVPAGIRVVELGGYNRRSYELLRNLLNKNDIIHCHDSLVLMRAAKSAHKPFVVTSHGIAPPWLRPSLRNAMESLVTQAAYPYFYRSAAAVVAISEYIARWITRVSRVRPIVIPNGVDDVRNNVTDRPSRRSLLYVGEISRRKGIDDLLSALRACPEDVTLDLVGRGDVTKYRSRAEAAGLANRVTFHSYVEDEDLDQMYGSCFATCSASKWEGYGMPVLEGFRWGRPAIVRAQGGMQELVVTSGAGECFARVTDFASCVAGVESNWEEMSRRALAFASTRSWPETFSRYEELFSDLIAGKT